MRRRTLVTTLVSLLVALAGSADGAAAAAPGCTPGVDGCIPTPEQCATGRYNGRWEGPRPGAVAVCAGSAGHVVQYTGGDATIPCGAVIEADVVLAGSWQDPNRCFVPPPAPGAGVPGNRYRPAIRSRDGVVAAESAAAAAVGRRVLLDGGNAVDAAVATVFAVGVTRPEMCGIGGRGYLLYRGANGRTAALDFYAAAPAAMRPDSMSGPGIDDLEAGHRTVGVPGVVAGMAAALSRFGTMALARLVAPAERLARRGVHVTPSLADAYSYQTYPPEAETVLGTLPFDPVPGKPHIAKLRAFPAAAEIYLQGGILPYPAGGTLVQTDYADSLAQIRRDGPRAFYRGRIARLIDAEMRRSRFSPLPGGRGLLTYEDLATYRPIWRRPLEITYRETTVLGAPPPSGSLIAMQMLRILDGFDVRGARHSSANHGHLVAEAQKLAFADFDAYGADPAFERVPTDVLLGERYVAARRRTIDAHRAGDPGPGNVGGSRAPSGTPATGGHTTHVSVIDEKGNAVSVTCSLGTGFGSGVVAPGTGFLLNSTNHYFNPPGHPNEAEPRKRPANAQAPLIVVRGGVPVLVAGGSGGARVPSAIAQVAMNVVDFGMDVGRAVDAARFAEPYCCTLAVEDLRIPPAALAELERRGHQISRAGEYAFGPWVQAAGLDAASGHRLGASDPRGDYGTAAV